MARYTTTPWQHPADLLALRAQLYPPSSTPPTCPPDPDPRAQATARILQAWKPRSPNLPHAIESTALLIDAQLHHTKTKTKTDVTHPNPNTTANSTSSIRAVYAAAFARFVTGFCDIGRARENFLSPASMAEVARRIGMPAEFVALRHEVVHEEVPGLGRLVGATGEALGWLWGVYWAGLGGGVGGDVSSWGGGDARGEARVLLRAYRSARRAAFKAGRQGGAEHRAEVRGYCDGLLTLLCAGADHAPGLGVEAVNGVLVEEKLLLPAKRTPHTPMTGAFALWDPLLAACACAASPTSRAFSHGLTLALMRALVASPPHAADAENAEKQALAEWVLHLAFRTGGDGNVVVREEVRGDLVRVCCLWPGYWSRVVGGKVLELGGEGFAEEWGALFAAGGALGGGVGGAGGGGGVGGAGVVGGVDGGVDVGAGGRAAVVDEEGVVGGWRRAALAPRVPIGVVA
ncbi:hypothetical protein LTR08_000429 [Meristemomyces frigidus]|nr:hypothetical protein LTR08_000429 [Meristemomyces frigidus]